MIDLSNVNRDQRPDFRVLRERAGQRRCGLKLSEGATFDDSDCKPWRKDAIRVGFGVVLYHFGRPHEHTPGEEADHVLRLLHGLRWPHKAAATSGRDLKLCYDAEEGTANAAVGKHLVEFDQLVHKETGVRVVLYSYADYIRAMQLPASWPRLHPGWLAAYDRNDGREHKFFVPAPYKTMAAHQYTSRARMLGVGGLVDESHVFDGRALELPKGAHA